MGMKHLLLPVPCRAGTCAAHGGLGKAAAVRHRWDALDLPSCALNSAPAAIPMVFVDVVPGADGGGMEKVLGHRARPVLNTCPCETVN